MVTLLTILKLIFAIICISCFIISIICFCKAITGNYYKSPVTKKINKTNKE